MMKRLIKSWLRYDPLPQTASVRLVVKMHFREGLPFCPPWQGDFLFALAERNGCSRAMEVGFATGSTALYILAGMIQTKGVLTSIDYKQAEYQYLGNTMVEAGGYSDRHVLLEGNSDLMLPDLFKQGRHFELAFLDGWKTFDHLVIDVYYVCRMLTRGGFIVFDDTRMHSVNKVIRLLVSHYAYEEVDYREYGEGIKLRLWQILTTRSFRHPYRAFRKMEEEEHLAVSKNWTFWKSF